MCGDLTVQIDKFFNKKINNATPIPEFISLFFSGRIFIFYVI